MESAQKPVVAQFFMYLRNKREQNIQIYKKNLAKMLDN